MNKAELQELVDADLRRFSDRTNFKVLIKNLLINPRFKYMYVLRKCNYYSKTNKIMYVLYRFLLNRYTLKYGWEIPHQTKIGKGFYISHYGGITVNGNTVIGENVNILTGALLGYSPRGLKKGTPTIGNKVWIGPNSAIVGNVNIGNNVLIAPNAYVNFDVPDNSIVIGNPGKIIESQNATQDY